MSEYAWFKLLIRAIGVLLLGLSIPAIVHSLWWLVMAVFRDDPGGPVETLLYTTLPTLVYDGVRAAIGVYLLIGAERLIRFCLRDLSGYCLACGYPIADITVPACP